MVYFFVAIYTALRAEADTKTKSDSILVLGAKSYHGQNYNPCLLSRVKHAAELYKSGYAPKIIMSGGYDIEDNISEAETMQKIAIENGIPAEAILLEKAATSTYENFYLSQKVLQENELRTVIIVTEPFHQARASLVAQKLGINFTLSPAIDSQCWKPAKYLTKYFLKEPVAILSYKLQNKL